MDQELIAFLEERFRKQEEMSLRALAAVKELRDYVHLLGEAVITIDERLQRFRVDIQGTRNDIQQISRQDQDWVSPILDKLAFQCGELSYRHQLLDCRVRSLEVPKERRLSELLEKLREIVNRPCREAQPASE